MLGVFNWDRQRSREFDLRKSPELPLPVGQSVTELWSGKNPRCMTTCGLKCRPAPLSCTFGMRNNGEVGLGSSMSRRVFISVGEVSGDRHAGNLIRQLLTLDPTLQIEGNGAPP